MNHSNTDKSARIPIDACIFTVYFQNVFDDNILESKLQANTLKVTLTPNNGSDGVLISIKVADYIDKDNKSLLEQVMDVSNKLAPIMLPTIGLHDNTGMPIQTIGFHQNSYSDYFILPFELLDVCHSCDKISSINFITTISNINLLTN